MTRKTSIIYLIGNYFASKGKVLTAEEYKNAEDAPVRFQIVKRVVGSWSRLLNMVGDITQYDGTVPDEVVHNNVDAEEVEESEEELEEPVKEAETPVKQSLPKE